MRELEQLGYILRDFMHRMEREGYVREWRTELVNYDDTFRLTAILYSGQACHWAITHAEMRREFMRWLEIVEDHIRSMVREPTRIRAAPGRADFEREHLYFVGWDTGYDKPDPVADNKARDLFAMVAGKAAFDTLNAYRPLPITGSNGTAYTLHKRASYCVERVSDGAKLCAVVPGVPLWDHLLGIKLMVEHDEDKFLKTANVARTDLRGVINWNTTA